MANLTLTQKALPDFRAAHENVLQLRDAAVAIGDSDVGHLAIHIVLRFEQLAAIHFAENGFQRDDVPLGLVEGLHWDADNHLVLREFASDELGERGSIDTMDGARILASGWRIVAADVVATIRRRRSAVLVVGCRC